MNLEEIPQVFYGLVVDDDLWLRQKSAKAILDSELVRCGSSVLGPAGAPKVQLHTLLEQLSDMPYYA